MTLNKPAKVRVTLTRDKTSRSFTRRGRTGRDTVVLRDKKLRRGRYRLVLTATDAAGNQSVPVRRPFVVR